jgi:hypothetical protein
MSNPYSTGKGDPDGLFDAILGPHAYSYYNKIKAPGQMGMSSDGSIDALTNDVAGLVSYVELLAFGKSEASISGGPLGNKYFLQTAAKCYNTEDKEQDRYIYINNIPDGKFDLLPNNTGMSLTNTEFEGLIPGVMEDVLRLNPMQLFQSFVTGSKPKCTEVTLPVGDSGEPGVNPPNCDIAGSCETHYLLDVDIKGMNSAWFSPSHPKPSIQEGFATWTEAQRDEAQRDEAHSPSDMPTDPVIKFWYGALGMLGLYILMKFFKR